MALIDKYTKEELKIIVENSNSLREVLKTIGYQTVTGGASEILKHRLDIFNIDYSHFHTEKISPIKRNENNVFIENSTASQATLRRWYVKGEYTKYECSICGQKPEWQGKPLTLILDHINGCNTDHRLENLRWVCPNCNQQLDTTGFKLMRTKDLQKPESNCCIDCGAEISKNATRCIECEQKRRAQNITITREELKSLIRTKPFTVIASEFNVSDNAIRKWCDKFNLPRKKTDIIKYSNEEWEKI